MKPFFVFGTARIVGQVIKSGIRYRSLFHRFALGVSREFKYYRVSVDSSTLYSQFALYSLGDSLLQRLQPRLEFLLPLSLKLKVNAQPPDTFYQKFWPAKACSLALWLNTGGKGVGTPP